MAWSIRCAVVPEWFTVAESEDIAVEVAYALPDRQHIVALSVPCGCSAFEAAARSGIAALFDELDLHAIRVGIFGRVLADPHSHALRAGDRVELYRSLSIDPKAARAQRARKEKSRKD